ncbi:TPA: holo-ACP synthase [Candidatus Avacholeplasma faecigallinarum]|nr:holo-ACP synthase [Candidatus Avacholeplasma faecigallinarum]
MIGIDLVEHKDIYDKSEAFIKRVLSEMEFAIYQKITNKKRQVEYIASRFASKEALLKAYKKFPQHIDLKDISILNDPQTNAPYISCSKLNDKLEISITHTDNYSMAVVILHP